MINFTFKKTLIFGQFQYKISFCFISFDGIGKTLTDPLYIILIAFILVDIFKYVKIGFFSISNIDDRRKFATSAVWYVYYFKKFKNTTLKENKQLHSL